jgi:hypothetical protein
MDEMVTLVLADGSVAVVSVAAARTIVDSLWELGLAPGAVTAATRIVDAVAAPPALRHRVEFTEREDASLRRAADGMVDWRTVGG